MKLSNTFKILIVSAIVVSLYSCRSIPKKAVAVKPFYKDKYLGKWYEIARIDFRFEKNMNNTTANYSLKDDGKIKVVNRGYNYKKKEGKESVGTAKFVDDENVGMLKVSFFGPFYSGYNVLAIDEGYNYALVAGKNTDYLWILSREKTIPQEIKNQYLEIATNAGYDTNDLLWVEHD